MDHKILVLPITPLSAEAAAIFDVDVAEVSFASYDSLHQTGFIGPFATRWRNKLNSWIEEDIFFRNELLEKDMIGLFNHVMLSLASDWLYFIM